MGRVPAASAPAGNAHRGAALQLASPPAQSPGHPTGSQWPSADPRLGFDQDAKYVDQSQFLSACDTPSRLCAASVEALPRR